MFFVLSKVFAFLVIPSNVALGIGIAGLLLRRVLVGTKGRRFLILPGGGVLFAAACGVAAQAFYMNRVRATEGLLYGGLAGLGFALLLSLVSLPIAFLTVRKPVS